MTVDWQHVLVEGSFVVLPLLFAQWLVHRKTSREANARDQKRDFILTEHSPHSHVEEEGALHAENIRYPRVRINGSK